MKVERRRGLEQWRAGGQTRISSKSFVSERSLCFLARFLSVCNGHAAHGGWPRARAQAPPATQARATAALFNKFQTHAEKQKTDIKPARLSPILRRRSGARKPQSEGSNAWQKAVLVLALLCRTALLFVIATAGGAMQLFSASERKPASAQRIATMFTIMRLTACFQHQSRTM